MSLLRPACLLLLSGIAFNSVAAAELTSPINVSRDGASHIHRLEVHGSNVYVSWWKQGVIGFSRSTDAGLTFSEPLTLASGDVFFADMAASDTGGVCVLFARLGAPATVRVRCSTDAGATFAAEQNISPGLASALGDSIGRITFGGGYWHVVMSTTDGIYVTRSADGLTWGAPINVSGTSESTAAPDIATGPEDSVHLVWRRHTPGVSTAAVYYSRSTDAGLTFSAPVAISDEVELMLFFELEVDAAGVYVAWHQSHTPTTPLYFRRSSDAGATFDEAIDLGPTFTMAGLQMALGANGHVYLVYEEPVEGPRDLLLVHSTDAGTTFNSPLNVTQTASESVGQEIEIDASGTVHILWVEHEIPGDAIQVMYRRVSPGGELSPIEIPSPGTEREGASQLEVRPDGAAFITYQNLIDTNIYFVRTVVATDVGTALSSLLAQVQGLPVQHGIQQSLAVKVGAAARAFDRGNSRAAAASLQAFINQVRALRAKKLGSAQADALIEQAQQIITLLQGT